MPSVNTHRIGRAMELAAGCEDDCLTGAEHYIRAAKNYLEWEAGSPDEKARNLTSAMQALQTASAYLHRAEVFHENKVILRDLMKGGK